MVQKQKIIKVGNSLAVTLPASFVRESGYKGGEEVIVETSAPYNMMLVKPKKYARKASLSPEFFTWLNNFVKKNETLLKKLATFPEHD